MAVPGAAEARGHRAQRNTNSGTAPRRRLSCPHCAGVIQDGTGRRPGSHFDFHPGSQARLEARGQAREAGNSRGTAWAVQTPPGARPCGVERASRRSELSRSRRGGLTKLLKETEVLSRSRRGSIARATLYESSNRAAPAPAPPRAGRSRTALSTQQPPRGGTGERTR